MKPLLLGTAAIVVLLFLAWQLQTDHPGVSDGLVSTHAEQANQVDAQGMNLDMEREIQASAEEPTSAHQSRESAAEDAVRFIFLDVHNGKEVQGVSLHEASGAEVDERGRLRWTPRGAAEWISDANGEVQLQSHELPPIAFEVHAPGFGPGWISGEEQTSPDGRNITVKLIEASEWSGVIKNVPADASSSLTVHATATALELQALWKPVEHLEFDELHWQGLVSPDGSFSIPGLPGSVRLHCWAEHGGTPLEGLGSVMRLIPGETRFTEWSLPHASKISGRYLDLDGHPVVNAEIWAMTPLPELPNSRYYRGKEQLDSTRTDTEGRFKFDSLRARSVVITPGDEHMLEGLWPVTLTLPATESVLLQPLAKGWIEGRVLSSGVPLPNAHVQHNGEEMALCDPTGLFRIQTYGDQEVSLAASPPPSKRGQLLCREEVLAKAGDSGVVIHMEKPGSIAVSSINESGEAMAVWITHFPCTDLTSFSRTNKATSGLRLDILRPGQHVFWAEGLDGLVAISPILSVRWGEPTKSITLTPTVGVEVQVQGPPGKRWPGIVILRDGIPIGTKQLSTQRPSFWLPPGSYDFEFVSNDQELELTPTMVHLAQGKSTTIRMQ